MSTTFIENKKVQAFAGALVIVLILFIGAKTLTELGVLRGSAFTQVPTISVTGTGETYITPDIATFTYSVVEEAGNVGDAQQKATAKSNKIIDLLKTAGIDEKDIKTLDYTISPQYDYESGPCPFNSYCPGKSVLKGYQVSQSVFVKVRNTSKAGDILAQIGTLNVSNLGGLQFTVDNDEALASQVRTAAIADARVQAEKIAKSLGVSLGKITNFYEDNSNYPRPFEVSAVSAVSDMKAMAPQLPHGQNKFVSKVTVTYEIH